MQHQVWSNAVNVFQILMVGNAGQIKHMLCVLNVELQCLYGQIQISNEKAASVIIATCTGLRELNVGKVFEE